MSVRILVGDCLEKLPELAPGSADVVITDPIWPNVPTGMFDCPDPHALLRSALEALPGGVKRLVIVMRADSDPRFLTAVPERWPFFHAAWLSYALPGFYGRRLSGREVAYCFGEPVAARRGVSLISGICSVNAQSVPKNGHPCPRALDHMRWLVKFWSEPGETILDPFAGSGTTGVAAAEADRNAILVELNPKYAAMAEARVRAVSLFGKVELRAR